MLTLKPTKNGCRFEIADEDSETIVSLSTEDDEQTLLRKLHRVTRVVAERTAIPLRPPLPVREPWDEQPVSPPDFGPTPATSGGWHKAPELPERLKGEVELIDRSEDA